MDVLDAARGGDREALGLVWRRWNPSLVRYLAARGAASAEDLAADIWIEVARSLPRFSGGEDEFPRWLFTIARRRLVDELRRPVRGVVTSTGIDSVDGRSPEHLVVEHDAVDRAIALVRRLPADQAEAVLLRVVAGLEVAEVAEVMGRSAGAVRVLAHRGLRRLAEISSAGVTEESAASMKGAS